MGASLVIATASPLIQQGLNVLLRDIPELETRASLSCPDAVVAALRRHRPDVLVIDPTIFAAVKSRYQERHRPRVLLLSSRAHIGTAPICGQDCACGFVSDRAKHKHLRAMLKIIGACRDTLGTGYCESCPLRSSLSPPPLPLSEREYMVFVRIGHGEGTGQIAKALGLSVKTVETYRESIKRKFGLGSAAALQEAAAKWKWGEFIDS